MADIYGEYADYNGYGGAYQASFGYGRAPAPAGGGGGGYNAGYPPTGPPAGYGPPHGGGGFNADQGYPQSPLDSEIASVLHEMRAEISNFDASPEFSDQYRNAKRLLTQEVVKLETNNDPEWLELDIEKQIKLVKKVLIPAWRHPRFNFVGKVIGPKGVTLQNIAKTFKCHVYVLGKGSSRDRAKEQELLATGDPQYAHYNGPLHVKIETSAPPALAYKRMAGVLEVLEELLKPVKETYIEGITPMPESMKKEDDGAEGENDDAKKEPIEESKIKIEKDYGPDLESKTSTPSSNFRGGAGGGGFSRGAPRGGGRGTPRGFNSDRGGSRDGGPMRRGGSFGTGGNSGHFGGPPGGFGGSGGMPMNRGAPMRGRGGGDRGGFGGSRGGGDRGFRGSRGGGSERGFRGRGGERFQPY